MAQLAVARCATTIDVRRGVFIFPEEALSLWPRRATRPQPMTAAQARARLHRHGAPPLLEIGAPAWASAPRRALVAVLRRLPTRYRWAKALRLQLGSAW